MTTQLSIWFLFESVIQKRVKFIAFDADNSDFFKYVSTIFMQFLGSFYNPNPEYTLENPKWAERVVTLTIRRRKSRAFQICIHFYCAIIQRHWGLIYQKFWVYTRKSEMSWESCGTCHSTQENKGSSNMYPLLLCDHWGLFYRIKDY